MLSLIVRNYRREVKSSISCIQRRSFFNKSSERQFKIKHNLNENWKIIYKAPMQLYVLSASFVTSASAVVVGAYWVVRLFSNKELSQKLEPEPMTGGRTVMSESDHHWIVFGLAGLCIAMRLIVHKYAFKIYRNNLKYVAVYEGNIPLTNKLVYFDKGAVRTLPVKGIMPWREFRYSVNGRSTILFDECFRSESERLDMQIPEKTPNKDAE
ncbi:CLUMA_CG008518, isoform A [Clunio marinus]|uniref:CLUMA_CG008518, isoform A n=1 Tax=Clunio marinus TaxID=568069 RepID=A0A1J1I401_9DIPT|nr:CLUMA_CG008518, isoform A [Clunio marinus]